MGSEGHFHEARPEANNIPPSNAEAKNGGATNPPLQILSCLIKHRNKFAFHSLPSYNNSDEITSPRLLLRNGNLTPTLKKRSERVFFPLAEKITKQITLDPVST
jgi:succinylglutamate desuccinylase